MIIDIEGNFGSLSHTKLQESYLLKGENYKVIENPIEIVKLIRHIDLNLSVYGLMDVSWAPLEMTEDPRESATTSIT